MKLKTLLLTALAACLIPTLAQAQGQSIAGGEGGERQRPSGEERGERFDNADTNGDGQLSLEEVESADAKRLAEHFDKIDADGDGQLTKEELKAAHKKRGKGKKGGNGPRSCDNCAE